MKSTEIFARSGFEARLAATRHERQSENVRLEKIKIRLREKMEVAGCEKQRPNLPVERPLGIQSCAAYLVYL